MAAKQLQRCVSKTFLRFWRRSVAVQIRYVASGRIPLSETGALKRNLKLSFDKHRIAKTGHVDFSGSRFWSQLPRCFSAKRGGNRGAMALENNEYVTDDDIEASVKSSRKTGPRKTTMQQKTSKRGLARPSRYAFTDVKGEEEIFRWERRPLKPRLKSDWYARQLLRLIRENQVDQALEAFYSLKEEGIRPTVEMFNVLISGLARANKVRRAFNLYNDMKKQGLKPTSSTYTSLFAACIQSPVPSHSLQRAEKLREEITARLDARDLDLHVITCNASMKAFAVCGSPLTAFDIYDELQEHEITPDIQTYSMLLTACEKDKDRSASKALRVVEEMKVRGLKPDTVIYNLLLKVLRNARTSNRPDPPSSGGPVLKETEVNTDAKEEGGSTTSVETPGQVSGCGAELFPGVEGFLQAMAMDDVTPDVRTFNLLLQLAGSGYCVDPEYLLLLMRKFGIEPDQVFLNAVVKHKALLGELREAKGYVDRFSADYGVAADQMTYQALAAGCSRQKQGIKLLEEMKCKGLGPSTAVYGTLVARAAKLENFAYLTDLLKVTTESPQRMKHDRITPTQRIISVLDRAASRPPRESSERLEYKTKEYHGFRGFYTQWKIELKLQSSVENEEDGDDARKYDHL